MKHFEAYLLDFDRGCPVFTWSSFILFSQVLRENEMLRREVDVKESKLSSSMNSIKTFWSPELKKERALRKDEVSKIAVWKEQYRVIQDEAQVSCKDKFISEFLFLSTLTIFC